MVFGAKVKPIKDQTVIENLTFKEVKEYFEDTS